MDCYTLLFLVTINIACSSAKVSNDDLQKLADANNILAAVLYPKLVAGNSDNLLYSPSSFLAGLGIMLYGARGNTQKELYSVLGYEAAGLSNDKVPSTFHYYFNEVLPEKDKNTIYYTMSCADEVLVTKNAPLYPKFQKEVQETYSYGVKNVDFLSSRKVAKNINSYVKENTFGNVHHVVNNVNDSSSALAVDVAYFAGYWEKPFPSAQTFQEPFYGVHSQVKNVSFMHMSGTFLFTKTKEYQAIELPYKGGNVCLLVILPNQPDGLSNLEKNITSSTFTNILNQLNSTAVYVSLPKFNLIYNGDFSKAFKELGAKTTYDGPADFSGMTSNKNLVVSGTLHKAVLGVDEEGSQLIKSLSHITSVHSNEFKANHPFMVAVVDRRTNLLFFLGRITNL